MIKPIYKLTANRGREKRRAAAMYELPEKKNRAMMEPFGPGPSSLGLFLVDAVGGNQRFAWRHVALLESLRLVDVRV